MCHDSYTQNQITHRHEKLLKIVESLVHASGSKRILGIGSVTGFFDSTYLAGITADRNVEDNKEYDTYRQRQMFAEDRYPVILEVADFGEDTVKIVQLFLTRLPAQESLPAKRGQALILDIGCSTGYNTKLLAVLYGKAIGIDINPKLLAYSRQFNWDKICVMDMHSMAFKAETFDMVFANNVLEHSYNPDKVLREIMRILKPGGYLAAMIPMDGENVRVLIGVDRGNVAHAWKTTFRDCEWRFRSAGYTNLTIYRHSYQQVTGRKRLLGDKFGVFIAQKGIQASMAITSPVYERMVVMADLSEPALQLAKTHANARSASISLIKCDAFQLPFRDESFDVIFHQGFLEHFKHPEVLIQKQKRILKRGGYLVVSVPRRYYTVGQLEQLIVAHDFQIVGATGWGYYPWIFHIVRHLSKVRRYKLGKVIFPSFVSRFYDKLWEKFERSRVALYTFVDLIVVVERK